MEAHLVELQQAWFQLLCLLGTLIFALLTVRQSRKQREALGVFSQSMSWPSGASELEPGTAVVRGHQLKDEILFMPHQRLSLRLADAWTLIRAGLAIALGRRAFLKLK